MTEKKCTFTVNKEGTAFAVCGDENETKTAGFIPAVRMTNPDHIRIVSLYAEWEGSKLFLGRELLRIDRDEVMPGKNTVTLETKDGAGMSAPWNHGSFMFVQAIQTAKSQNCRRKQAAEG